MIGVQKKFFAVCLATQLQIIYFCNIVAKVTGVTSSSNNSFWKISGYKVKIFLAFVFFYVYNNEVLLAQSPVCDCFIQGIVRDHHSHLPIAGATVLIEGQNKGVFTDEAGNYRLSGLCPGSYTLESRIVGYQPVKQTINLHAGHKEDFDLEEDEVHLHAVEISANRTDAPSSQPLTTLIGSELDLTRGNSLAESLKGVTGVNTLQTGSSISKPVIHGLHSNRVLIINNGVRQEGQQWGSEHAPEIDPFVARRVSVVKGAAGVRYGSDAIGGVILVEPEELPFNQSISGEVNLVGFSNGRQGVTSGTVQGGVKGLEGFGWRAQGTFKRGGNSRTPNYFLDNTGIREKNFSIGAGYRRKGFGLDVFYSRFNTQLGIFSGAHIGSITDLMAVIANGEPFIKSGFSYSLGRPYQDVTHDLLKAEAHYHFTNGNRIQWTFAKQMNDRSEFDLHRPRNDSLAALNKPELNFKLTTLTNDVVWDHKPLFGKLAGQVGVSTLYQYNMMSGRPLIPNFDQFTAGVFWIERWVKNNWELEGGIRYDRRWLTVYRFVNKVKVTDQFDFGNLSGTLGASRTLSEKLTARLNLGTAWRAPNVSELFSDGVHHGSATYEQGDASLKPEQAFNSIASIAYASDRVKIELGGYFNYINQFMYLKPQSEPIQTIRGAFPYFKYTETNASFAGVDLSATTKVWGGLSWITKVSYLRAYDVKNDDYLVLIPSNRWENQLKFELSKWGKTKDTFISVGNLLVGEQKRVPDNSDFLAPPSGYSLWNAQLGTTIPFSSNQELEVSLVAQNIFDTVYRDYMNRFRYYTDDLGRNLSLRIKWKFGGKTE